MSDLQREVAGLFPDFVGAAAVAIGAAPALWPGEADAVARAVPHRQQEFAAGRAAARAAMVAAGLSAGAIPVAEDRSPVWPQGVTGSITHARDVALAVAAPLTLVSGLGLDVEPDLPLPDDVLSDICDDEECSWIASQREPLRWARLIFVAKEAAFKCQYPASRTIFGFEVMQVRVDPDAGSLVAGFKREIAPFANGAVLHGRYVRTGGAIIAGFIRAAE
ncbi:4'-phosphopantetheinyl transferase family protein [Paracoccus salsus]|uniref:4'-phosphopantetheinyl transferase family protein n=1 Tax=Paracoccus salsus TaxID=2911061 RepID=UPI001F432E59|nr:4'-phosphopantetheinyl transferase superfamily protein [Paracoccus salsus]MCF3972232.1 4'-phosphopantetheinyl transferase superfamily protein [Paracoccus salsus]